MVIIMNNSPFINELTRNQNYENLGSNFNSNNYTKNYFIDETHPLQPSPNTFIRRYKFLNINSKDRNVLKYPKSTTFKYQLPSPLNSITEVTLYNYDFPNVQNTFSQSKYNISLIFSINNPFVYNGSDVSNKIFFEYLNLNKEKKMVLNIEEGNYTNETMKFELQNRLNDTVSQEITEYARIKYPSVPNHLLKYNRFKVLYNEVSQKIDIGNICDGFSFLNQDVFLLNKTNTITDCSTINAKSTVGWGLPFNLGFSPINVKASSYDLGKIFYNDPAVNSGIWCEPDTNIGNEKVFILKSDYKLNLLGSNNYFMQLLGFNNIDSSLPFNWDLNYSTNTSNKVLKNQISNTQTNGMPDLFFAKIPIERTKSEELYGFSGGFGPTKYFNPPFNNLKELSIKIVDDAGEPVNFENYSYSFMLRFTIISPQIVRTGRIAGGENSLMSLSLLDKQYLQEQNPKDDVNPGY